MQVFEPKSKTKSAYEKAHDLVNKEMGLLLAEKKRVESEVLGRISAVNDSLKTIEERSFKKADSLRSEIADLEQKKVSLETAIKALKEHPDEVSYKAKYAELALKERSLNDDRLRVDSELASIDSGRSNLARLIEQNEAEYIESKLELSKREQKVVSAEKDLISRQEALSVKEKDHANRSMMLDKRTRDLDLKEERLQAMERGASELMRTLNDLKDSLGKERLALKDGYEELQRSKERLDKQYGKR